MYLSVNGTFVVAQAEAFLFRAVRCDIKCALARRQLADRGLGKVMEELEAGGAEKQSPRRAAEKALKERGEAEIEKDLKEEDKKSIEPVWARHERRVSRATSLFARSNSSLPAASASTSAMDLMRQMRSGAVVRPSASTADVREVEMTNIEVCVCVHCVRRRPLCAHSAFRRATMVVSTAGHPHRIWWVPQAGSRTRMSTARPPSLTAHRASTVWRHCSGRCSRCAHGHVRGALHDRRRHAASQCRGGARG